VSTFNRIFPLSAHLIIVHKRAAGVFSGNYMLQYHAMFSTVKPVIKCKDLWDDVRLPGEGYFFREPRYDHPGLTGLAMTEKILLHFSKEGDTVLDPFLGTGTTLVACKKMNRSGIGIEQSTKYLEMAEQRLGELK
jgi:DNA modification methylase